MRNARTYSPFEKATSVICSVVLATSLFGVVPANAAEVEPEPEVASETAAAQEADASAPSARESAADVSAVQEAPLSEPVAAAVADEAAATLQSDDSSDEADEKITNIYTVDQLVDAAANGGTFRLVVDLYINIESGKDIYQCGVINVPLDTSVAVTGTITKSIEVKDGKKLKLLMYDPTTNTPHRVYFDSYNVEGGSLFDVHDKGELSITHDYKGETKDGLYGAVRKDVVENASDHYYRGAVQVHDGAQFTLGTRISGFACTTPGLALGNAVSVRRDSTFTMAHGAAIEECSTLANARWSHGAVGVEAATFNFNEGTIENCVDYAGGGAAILSIGNVMYSKSQITMGENAEIRGCRGRSGSAVFIQEAGSMVMKGSIIGCSMVDSRESYDGTGTIELYESTLTMEGGAIQGNTSKHAGSAVYAIEGSTFTGTGGKITGNTSLSGEGAIYAKSSDSKKPSKVILDGVEISGNTTPGATKPYGPVQVGENGIVTMKSGLVAGDGGATWGGSVAVLAGGTFNMEGGTLRGGKSTRFYGGCVYVLGTFSMTGGTIEGGTANRGGAIYQQSGTVKLDGGTISNCKATDSATEQGLGGLLYMEGGTATVTGKTQFGDASNDDDDKFVAETAGGYFYMEKGSLTLSGVTLEGGHAQHGGAIYQLAGSLTLENCAIKDNMASVVDTDPSNAAGDGPSNIGGEGVGGGLCVIGNVEATQVTLKGSTTFSGNRADKGAMGKKVYGQDIYLDYVATLEKRDNDANIKVNLDNWTGTSRVAISAQSLELAGERVLMDENGENAQRGFTLDTGVTDYTLVRSGYNSAGASFRLADEKWQSITDAASLAQAFEKGGYWTVDASFAIDHGDFALTTVNPTLVIDFKYNWITVRYDKLTKPFITVPEGTRLKLMSSYVTDQPQGGLTSDLTKGTQTLLNLTGGTTTVSCGIEYFKAEFNVSKGIIAEVSGTARLVLDKANITRNEVKGTCSGENSNQLALIRVKGSKLSNSDYSNVSSAASLVMDSGFICSNSMKDAASPVFVASGVFLMNGGSICHNYTSYGATDRNALAVFVGGARDDAQAAQFCMRGGSITGNYSLNERAYSVVVGGSSNPEIGTSGTMTMIAGSIDAGRCTNIAFEQGALSIGSWGVFTMKGGLIDGNNVGRCVFVLGHFTLESGTLQNGKASTGGGVFVGDWSEAEFKATGGSITNCSADRGGAVFVRQGKAYLTSGSVLNCSAKQGGAFYVSDNGRLEAGSACFLTNNSAEEYGRVAYIADGGRLFMGGQVTSKRQSLVEDIWIDSTSETPARLVFLEKCTVGLKIGVDAKNINTNPSHFMDVTVYGDDAVNFVEKLRLPDDVRLTQVGSDKFRWYSQASESSDCKADPTDSAADSGGASGSGEGSSSSNSASDAYAKVVTYNVTATYDQASANSLLASVDHERGKNNLPNLTSSLQLEQIAMQRAAEIALKCANGTSLRPDGTSCYTAFNDYQCAYMFEADAAGCSSAKEVLNKWLADSSMPIRLALLNANYTFAGVAHAKIGGKDYWVIALGDAAGVSPSQCIPYGTTSVACEVPTNLFNGGTLCLNSWSQIVAEGKTVLLPEVELEMTTSEGIASIPGSTLVYWASGDSSIALTALSGEGPCVMGKGVGQATLTAYVWKDELCERYVSTKVTVTHDLIEHAAVPATCSEAGSSTYYSCNVCDDKYFSDSEGKNEIAKDSWVIKPLGHAMTEHAAVAATCTEAGSSAHWDCGRCGKYFADAEGKTEIAKDSWVIKPLGHAMTEHAAVAATCTEAGSSAHWDCSRCGKYFSDAEGKTEIAKDSWIVKALGHDLSAKFIWGDGLATATAHVTCSRCDFASDVAATVQTSSQGDVFTAVAKATFEGKEYTEEKTSTLYGIEYHLLGGLNAATNPMRYITESATIELAGATRAGYTFAGWYDNEACSGAAVTQIAKGSTGKVELWAKWSYDLRGDITVNGKLNIVDAQVVYDLACAKYGENFEKYPLRENWTIGMLRETADVNHDGEVNSSDAFAIQRAVHYGWEE